MDWQITGHKKQVEFLQKAIERGNLAHAYTFAGPDSSGMKNIAKKLAGILLDSNNKDFHPDYFEIISDNGIKIEQIRELTYKLALKPYQAKYKVAVIDSAETLTTEAANALLKTLEEPKEHTILILITNNPNRLPKTIISRTQKIIFAPAVQQVNQPEKFYEIFQSTSLVEKLIAAYEMAEMESVEIKNVLEIWLRNLENELLRSATKVLASKISAVARARNLLDQNVNSKLLLTNLMLSA